MSETSAQMVIKRKTDPLRIIEVAKSTLELKIEDFNELFTGKDEIVSNKIKLMVLSDASWTIAIQKLSSEKFYFRVNFHEFPNALISKSNAVLSVTCKGEEVSKYNSGALSGGCIYHDCSKSRLTEYSVNDSITLKFRLVISCDGVSSLLQKFYDLQVAWQARLKGHSSMFKDPTFSDFTFIVGDREFKVHRNILAAASPVMQKMFTSNLEEAKTKTCRIDAITPETFDHLLRFIYRGELPGDLKSAAKPLYEAAHYYEIEHLKEICRQEIQGSLSPANALEVFEWVQPYEDLKELKMEAWTIVKHDILKIFVELKDELLSLEHIYAIIEHRELDKKFWNKLEEDIVAKTQNIEI